MSQTKDFAKLGQTTFVAQVFRRDGDEPYAEWGNSSEHSTLGAAKEWMRNALRRKTDVWWGDIGRGTYEDCSFDSADYGFVNDAEWERDGEFYCHCFKSESRVEFDVEDGRLSA